MFLIRYTEAGESEDEQVVLQVKPKPTEVAYPDRRLFSQEDTKDGVVVIQRPRKDARPREWVWTGYPPRNVQYNNLWAVLESLEVKSRLDAELDPEIEIWENDSGTGGFGETDDNEDPDFIDYSNIVFVKVKFIQVTRTNKGGGGPAAFTSSRVVFVITDPDWSNF